MSAPRLPRESRRTERITILVTQDEWATISAEAARNSQTVSEYIRQRAMCFCPKVEVKR